MKPFNLEKAKAGKPVCTRDGRPARILCFDFKMSNNTTKILCAIASSTQKNTENTILVDDRGYYTEGYESRQDLMMTSKKHEGWINVYYYNTDGCTYTEAHKVFPSKEEAKIYGSIYKAYIATIHIEWEE